MWFSASIQKPSQFRPPAQKLSQSIPTQKTSHCRPSHKNQAISIPTLKNKSISIHKLKPRNFGPAHKAEVDFDARAKNKSISISQLKPSYFRSRKWNHVNFDSHSNIKSISMPRHKNPVNFDPDTENRTFPTATQNPNQCRSTTLKWHHFGQPAREPNIHHPTLEPKKIRSRALKASQFWPCTRNASQFACFLKTRYFRPACKIQVSFDRLHNNQSI